jgi:dTDP-4-amino-4,6-dideoxygalactose transaminase
MRIDAYSPTIRRKEMDAVLTAMVQEHVGPGDQSQKLIQTAKEYLEFDSCLALRSPVNAIMTALLAMDLPEKSEILISALSPAYYVNAISDLGFIPVCCDVEESTGNLTMESVKQKCTSETRALIAYHSLGLVTDTPQLMELGLPVVEDCSKSFGAHWGDRRAGSFGHFTVLGLEERDVLTAGGGALVYAMGRREGTLLRKYSDLYAEYRMPDLNASLAIVQFRETERNYAIRKEIAAVYAQTSLRTRHKTLIQIGESEYNNYTYPIVLETGLKDVRTYAAKKEVELASAFEDTVISRRPDVVHSCPIAASLALRTVAAPLYPRLGKAQVLKVAKVLATLP